MRDLLELRPDWLLTDISLGYFSGIDLVRLIREKSEHIITILTGGVDTQEINGIGHFYMYMPTIEHINAILQGKDIERLFDPFGY